MIYHIHDNGGRPFKVEIHDNEVSVFTHSNGDATQCDKLITYTPQKIFIGVDQTDNNNDGNSILLHIRNLEYVFIGTTIFIFTTECMINNFKSPIGNGDVPYPYAIDNDGNVYLFEESVILQNNDRLKAYIETMIINTDSRPYYDYYYDHALITEDTCYILPNQPKQVFENIVKFFIGRKMYTFCYDPNPKQNYEYYLEDFPKSIEKYGISVEYDSGIKTRLSKNEYIDLIERFGRMVGFKELKTVMIHDRT